MAQQRTAYDPPQLAAALGWSRAEFNDARRLQLLPDPDVLRPQTLGQRWSPRLARQLIQRRDTLAADLRLGTLGAYRAALAMTERLGTEVTAAAVAELSRLGFIPRAGQYKGHDLYAGWAIDRFGDMPALAQAQVSGRLLMTDEVARVLGIRRCDVNHLIRFGWLSPQRATPNSRGGGWIMLFRHGDLVALRAYTGIDWAAVRATPAGKPSPLVGLGQCDPAAKGELVRLSRGLLYHRLGHRRWAAGDAGGAVEDWRSAGTYPAAAEHMESVMAGSLTLVDRCAAWIALLPPAQADLV